MNFITETNRIYARDAEGRLLAEVTFPESAPGIVSIDHTFVDDSLRGQGVAGKLMETAATSLRATRRRAVPVCSYAVHWFEKHEEYADILYK